MKCKRKLNSKNRPGTSVVWRKTEGSMGENKKFIKKYHGLKVVLYDDKCNVDIRQKYKKEVTKIHNELIER